MRRVAYKTVLAQVASLWAGLADPSATPGLSVTDAALACTFINRRLRQYWKAYHWPPLRVMERRRYRPTWDVDATYALNDQVFYPPARQYYQCLAAGTTIQEPAILIGTEYEDNSPFWALAESVYSAEQWTTGTDYLAGDHVLWLDDREYYVCITAHTAGASFDPTKWVQLIPFVRSIEVDQTETEIGDVREIWEGNPLLIPEHENNRIAFDLVDDALLVRAALVEVYVEFRAPVPSYTGTVWAGGTTYALGDQVYAAAQGDYYRSLKGTNTDAVTVTASWARIDFPEFLQDAVAIGAFADLCKHYGQIERWGTWDRESRRDFESAVSRFQVQQSQHATLRVRTAN